MLVDIINLDATQYSKNDTESWIIHDGKRSARVMDSSSLKGSNCHFHWQVQELRAIDHSTYVRPFGYQLSSEEDLASLTESTGLSPRST